MFHDFAFAGFLSFCCIHHFSLDNLSQHQTETKTNLGNNTDEYICFIGFIKQLSYHQMYPRIIIH